MARIFYGERKDKQITLIKSITGGFGLPAGTRVLIDINRMLEILILRKKYLELGEFIAQLTREQSGSDDLEFRYLDIMLRVIGIM